MRLISLLILSSLLLAAKAPNNPEKLEDVVSPPLSKMMRFAMAEEIYCSYMDLCDSMHYVTEGIKDDIFVISKTFSSTYNKSLTLLTVETEIKDLEEKCILKMKFYPGSFSVNEKGDFKKSKDVWSVREVECEHI